MTFAIMVRDLDARDPTGIRMLATDIPTPDQAHGMVERIAASYPDNGRAGRARRFRDREGLHEIWAAPIGHVLAHAPEAVPETRVASPVALRPLRRRGSSRLALPVALAGLLMTALASPALSQHAASPAPDFPVARPDGAVPAPEATGSMAVAPPVSPAVKAVPRVAKASAPPRPWCPSGRTAGTGTGFCLVN